MKIRTMKYYTSEAFKSFWRNSFMSVASIATVALALFILGLFSMLAESFADASMLIEIMTPFLVRHQKRQDSVDTQKTPFQWGVKSGKEIEKLNSAIPFCKEQTFYEGFRRRWGWLGILSVIPWWNRNCNNKIACLHFAAS